jgi:hypothetical protein
MKNMAWVLKQSVQVHFKKDNEMKGEKVPREGEQQKVICQIEGLHQIINTIGLHMVHILHQQHPCLYCGVHLQVCSVTFHGLILIL